MALKKTVALVDRLEEEFTFNAAYHKVTRIDGGKNGISFYVDVFKTNESPSSLKQTKYSFTPSLDGQNFIAQAYNHLKTLPEVIGAVDC